MGSRAAEIGGIPPFVPDSVPTASNVQNQVLIPRRRTGGGALAVVDVCSIVCSSLSELRIDRHQPQQRHADAAHRARVGFVLRPALPSPDAIVPNQFTVRFEHDAIAEFG